MAKISETFLARVREAAAINVVSIINRRVKLKATGKNFSVCCPFHDEKTPSFVVSPERGTFTCFGGCSGSGGSGNGLDFIIRYERVELPEAVRILAQELNLGAVEYLENPDRAKVDQKEVAMVMNMKSALVAASSIYSIALSKDVSVLQYLVSRGVTPSDIGEFKLGLAPQGFSTITKGLEGRFTEDVLLAASLIAQNTEKNRKFDFFNHRLMFPIRSIKGDIVGFGGRRLDGEKQAKYINSGQNAVFCKSKILYGLYESVSMPAQGVERGAYNVTEGYLDVIAGHRHGLTNTVGTMGTAVTEDQLKLLFQRASKVRFIMDGDKAGIEAIKKGMRTAAPLLTSDKVVTAVILPAGEDMDSLLLQSNGAETLRDLITKELAMSDFLVEYLISKNADSAEGNAKAAAEIKEIIALIQDENLKMTMRATLYRALGIEQVSEPALMVESAQQLFERLPDAMKGAIRSVPLEHRIMAGMLLAEPAWEKLFCINEDALKQLPDASAGLIRLASGFGRSALANKEHQAHALMNYLARATPSLEEQIEVVANYNQAMNSVLAVKAASAVVSFEEKYPASYGDEIPNDYEEYAKVSRTSMSHY